MTQNKGEANQQVIDGLSYLILEYASIANGDKERSEWVAKLRIMRNEFENLITGFIPETPKPTLAEQEKTLEAIEDRAQQMIMGRKTADEALT